MVVALCLVLSSALLAVVAIALQGTESVVVGLLVTATGIASFLIPAAAVIAIRRYRLYDLDLRAENWRAGTSDPPPQRPGCRRASGEDRRSYWWGIIALDQETLMRILVESDDGLPNFQLGGGDPQEIAHRDLFEQHLPNSASRCPRTKHRDPSQWDSFLPWHLARGSSLDRRHHS